MKRIAILGSTGSVGQNTVDVVLKHQDSFKVVALATNRNVHKLKIQVEQLSPMVVCLGSHQARKEFISIMPHYNGEVKIGAIGLQDIASMSEVDLLMISLVGSQGINPLMVGIQNQKDIAFVNKEALVMGGSLLMKAVIDANIKFIPVDSEHSAIYQCLLGESKKEIDHITLTSSGGPFRQWEKVDMEKIKPSLAIKHPQWDMGPKISVDSATLMNKGLEVIEAYWLFNLPLEKIKVIIHPQSIVHSMIEFIDGSIKAHLGVSDMRIPILYALSYPRRLLLNIPKLHLTDWKKLTFEEVDHVKFPALNLCYEACRLGHSYPAVINASNEVAVQAFLKQHISFLHIYQLVEAMMEQHTVCKNYTLEDILEIDRHTRIKSQQWVQKHSIYAMGG